MTISIRLTGSIVAIVACMAVVAACDQAKGPLPAATIEVLSSRADLVSGGDSLVAVTLPPSIATAAVAITLNDADVTSAFKPSAPGKMLGLVTGLKIGDNALKVKSTKLAASELVLKNHPITGPVFSGTREQPFYCTTDKFTVPASTETLGAPLDADCSITRRVDYVYRTNIGEFRPLPAGGAHPADLAQTTTSEGKSVPYIVRVETGTIDRAIFQTAVLSDPASESSLTPFSPPSAWNQRLVYTFGGGCTGGWYTQGASIGDSVSEGGILEDLMLRQGYAVASSSLNVFGNNCNHVLAAEVVSMVKEHFVETFGPTKFTIGWGCSGGSEQLHPIGDQFPGLVDGIIVGCSFPEVTAGMITNLTDAGLFARYLANTKLPWAQEQQMAASGYQNTTSPTVLAKFATRVMAQGGECDAVIPVETQFDKGKNPTGVRCDVYDHNINIFGRDPQTGAARRPLDNIGVQYGLTALNADRITKRQFIDLNQKIGGYDNDGAYSASRTVGDAAALQIAYQKGQVTYGGLGLKSTPIIDYRGYNEQPETPGEVHAAVHSFSMRERLRKANGSSDNQVMLAELGAKGTTGIWGKDSTVLEHALTQMDQWLTKLSSESSLAGEEARPTLAQITKSKPADLVDACFTDNGTVKIPETQVYDGNTKCHQLYPAFSTPRMVAGGPLTNDVLKCQLRPFNEGDYKVTFSPAELTELKAIFPDGVCDFSVAGVGQAPTQGTWPSF